MHAIAPTRFGPDRLDVFWTDPDFQVVQRTWDGTQWLGWYELGGRFATVPAAVASMARRPPVIAVGEAGDLGGPGMSSGGGGHGIAGGQNVAAATPADVAATDDIPTGAGGSDQSVEENTRRGLAASRRVGPDLLRQQRIDVFGVGLDYAMYTKTLWGVGADHLGPWFNLGGIFTSAPATIVWNDGQRDRIEVFGLGTDHAMFQKTWNGSAWTPDWTRLGGTFSSTASLVSWGPGRLDLFARGADFTLRHRTLTGSGWENDWQNLGGNLASEPVALSWGPDRLDVFAVFHDGMLWHRWWDGMIWNDWESLGGRDLIGGTFTSVPSAASPAMDRIDVFVVGDDSLVYRISWSDGAWVGPEQFPAVTMTSAPTVLSTQPDSLDLFAPGTDQNVYHRRFDGGAWQPARWDQLGGHVGLPTRYRFSVDYVTAKTTRSLLADTDTAAATIGAGNWPTRTLTQSMGDVGGSHPSQAQTNLLQFEPVTVELCEASVFSYVVVNNGNAAQKKLDDALVEQGQKLTEDSIKSISKQLGAGVGAIAGVELAGTIAAPIIGSLLGVAVNWLIEQLGDVVFADCDGLVAAAVIVPPNLGLELHQRTANGPWTMVTDHPGTDSDTGCGDNSDYEVTWSITRV